jgi:O-antigen ligase
MSGTPAGNHRIPAAVAAGWPWLLSLLLALMPLSFSVALPAKVIPPAMLFVCGLGLIARSQSVRRAYRTAWPVMVTALAMLGFMVISVLIHRSGWRPLDRGAHILLFLVIGAVFCQPLRMRLVWGGFAVTAVVLGTICAVQHHVYGLERAYGLNGGASASIQLATVLFGLGLLSLVQLLGAHIGRGERLLHGGALALAMYGGLLTESRGPLLAFAPIFVIVLVLHGRRTGRWRGALLLGAGTGIGLALAMATLHGQMISRFEAVQQEVASFDPAGDGEGAVRERLEMWRTAVRAAADHPLLGIGPNRFRAYVRNEIAAGRSNPAIALFNQPHNEYLNAAASGGVPGLLLLLLVLVWPLRYFLSHARDAAEAVALPASAGVATIGLFALCALTDSVFYRVMPLSFYFFMVAGLAMLIARQLRARADLDLHRVTHAGGTGSPGRPPAESESATRPVPAAVARDAATPGSGAPLG